ncbi:tRNA (guanosine(46)-N7)-methyltransferase TrmB [Aurantivibrio plasticivorans]
MTDYSELKPEFNKKSIRSYVIRPGRMTEGQKSAFNRYWDSYGLSLFNGAINPETLFPHAAPLVVEVGFGNGDSLLEMACAETDKHFIGIEVHPPGVGRLINSAGKAEVSNLKVYMADAVDVMNDCIPDNSIDRFQLFFPDPWHKKKHHKRRIVQAEFCKLVWKKLKPGGVFHLATDWENYAEHMVEVFDTLPEFSNLAGAQVYSPRPDYRPITKFERRGERLGHGVWDLLYQKPQ